MGDNTIDCYYYASTVLKKFDRICMQRYNLDEGNMICLSLDTTTDISSIGLANDSQLLAEYTFATHKDLSLRLMSNIKCMLKDCGLRMADLNAIGVSTGPGSFTGIRIGVVTAKTLAQVLNIPTAGITSLDLLALPFAYLPGAYICPLIKVRKGEAYYAIYKADGYKVDRICEYGAEPIGRIIDEIRSGSMNKVIFCGDALAANQETIVKELGDQAIIASEHYSYPSASLLALESIRQISHGMGSNAFSLLPFYIRKSAPEMLLEKSQAQQNK